MTIFKDCFCEYLPNSETWFSYTDRTSILPKQLHENRQWRVGQQWLQMWHSICLELKFTYFNISFPSGHKTECYLKKTISIIIYSNQLVNVPVDTHWPDTMLEGNNLLQKIFKFVVLQVYSAQPEVLLSPFKEIWRSELART